MILMNKKWLSLFAVFAVVLTIAWIITVHNDTRVALDDSAVQRSKEDVLDIH